MEWKGGGRAGLFVRCDQHLTEFGSRKGERALAYLKISRNFKYFKFVEEVCFGGMAHSCRWECLTQFGFCQLVASKTSV